MLYVGWMVWMGLGWMVIIGQRSSKCTFGANKSTFGANKTLFFTPMCSNCNNASRWRDHLSGTGNS